MVGAARRIRMLPIAELDEAPWHRERLQGYLDHDPATIALTMWALARTVAIYGLVPVAEALAELEGNLAADVLTAGQPVSLPLDRGAALGVAEMFVGAALGLVGDSPNRHYLEILVETKNPQQAQFTELRVPDISGRRWVFSIHADDRQSPGEHAKELGDAIFEWAEAKRNLRNPDAPSSVLRTAEERLHHLAAEQGSRRKAAAAMGHDL